MAYWLVVGPEENWRYSLQGSNLWGFPPSHENAWNRIQLGDTILFYATTPVKGLIGYGNVSEKLREDTPQWPREVRERIALWPLRIKMKVYTFLPERDWHTKAIRPEQRGLALMQSVQQLPEQRANEYLQALQEAVRR